VSAGRRLSTANRGLRTRFTALGVVLGISLAGSFAASVAWAFWTAGTLPGSTIVVAASVGAGNTPTASATTNTVTLTWAASTLSTSEAVSGYIVKRYDTATLTAQTIGSGCSGTITALTCTETAVPAGQWRYSVTPTYSTNWLGAESAKSVSVATETTPPVNALALSNVTGTAIQSGTTIYYNGSVAGSFTITNTLTDSGSGPASSSTATLGGTSTGWTHTASTVSSPAGGPYVSNTFSWTAGTTSSPTEVITGRDVIGNTAATTLTFVNDSTAPTGSITYTDGSQAQRQVSVTFSATDGASGLQSTVLQRASALYVGDPSISSSGNVTGSGCGAFGPYTAIGSANPSSPYLDSAVQNSTCYRYQIVVADGAGNTATIGSANTAIVDYANAVKNTAGAVSYWRFGEGSATASSAADGKGSNTGAYVGTVARGTSGGVLRDSNTAVNFGGNGYMQVVTPTSLPIGSAARSVEMWFKTTTSANPQILYSYGPNTTTARFGLALAGNGLSMTALGGAAANNLTFTMPSNVANDAWHHVVTTYNGSSINLYIDGTAIGAQAATRSTTLEATFGFTVGNIPNAADTTWGNRYFAGSIEEVSVYSAALSAATITNHYGLSHNANADTTGPTGGSIAATGLAGTGSLYSTSTTISLALTKPTTDATGVAASGARLVRATATLSSPGTTNGVCGVFSAFTLVVNDPGSTRSDTVSDQACYLYQYIVPDTLYNYTTLSSQLVKVDTTAPAAPAITLVATAVAGTNVYATGSQVFYRTNNGNGSFTLTAAVTDTGSGVITPLTFPLLGSGWTSTPTGLSTTYSFNASLAVANPGSKTLTATNNAGGVSPASSFTVTADNIAPAGGTISYTDGFVSTGAFPITLTNGTDTGGSGIASQVLQRRTAVHLLSGCLLVAAFTDLAVNPGPTYTDTLSGTTCYQYRWVITDNVGNVTIITNPAIAKTPLLGL